MYWKSVFTLQQCFWIGRWWPEVVGSRFYIKLRVYSTWRNLRTYAGFKKKTRRKKLTAWSTEVCLCVCVCVCSSSRTLRVLRFSVRFSRGFPSSGMWQCVIFPRNVLPLSQNVQCFINNQPLHPWKWRRLPSKCLWNDVASDTASRNRRPDTSTLGFHYKD
jgi:hypothetical protein